MQWKFNAAISEATETVSVRHRLSVLMNTASQKNKNFYMWKTIYFQ